LKDEAPKMPGWRTEIVGTDISHDILAKAKAGVNSQFDVQRGLPIQRPLKYFTKEGKSGRQS
jgi:chemotaxis protein methyltransferase CheR